MESAANSVTIHGAVDEPLAVRAAIGTDAPQASDSHWRWLAPVLITALVFVAFVPALTAGLVDWDDDDLLLIETRYRELTPESLKWMFTTTLAGHYQPLTWLSYSFDWWLWRREMFGYHLTSVALHAGAAVVFFCIVRRLIGSVDQGIAGSGAQGIEGASDQALEANTSAVASRSSAASGKVVQEMSDMGKLLFARAGTKLHGQAALAHGTQNLDDLTELGTRVPPAACPSVLPGLGDSVATKSFCLPRSRMLILSSAAAAAFFAVHPLRVESVAWLAERRDVLSGFFYLLCILFYVRYVGALAVSGFRSQAIRSDAANGPACRALNYGAALLCCALSLLAKASGVTLPIVLLILDVFPLRRRQAGAGWVRGAIFDKLPFVAICIPAALVAYAAQREQGAMYPLSEYGLDYRMAQALYGLTFYVFKTVWPSNLGPLYQLPSGDNLLGPLLWQGAAGTAAIFAAALVFLRIAPAISAAILYYVVQILPVLGFAQSGPQLVADRYSYLPTLGFAALAGAGVYRVAKFASRGNRDMARLLGLGVVTLIVALAHATFRQSDVWLSPLSLWSRGVQVSPASSIARTNRGDALVLFQFPAAALQEYKTALSLNPRDAVAVRHMAKLLLTYGDSLRAAAFYEYAVTLDPTVGSMYPDYATALERSGQPGAAIEVLRKRLAAVPDDLACTAYLAHLLSTHPADELRNGPEAVELAVRVNQRPGGPDARSLLLLATALAEVQRFDEAVAIAEDALRMARAMDDRQRMGQIEQRLELFRRNEPYRGGR